MSDSGHTTPEVTAEKVLRSRLAELEQRVAALEGPPALTVQPDSPGSESTAAATGTVSYHGDVTLAGHIEWNISLVAGAVLELPNGAAAAVLAGLGHPTRAALTRRLLAGPATTAELQQAVQGSTGQLYHHLRTLTGCGVAEHDGRGRYRVPPKAVVPVLVLLLAASDVASDLVGGPAPQPRMRR